MAKIDYGVDIDLNGNYLLNAAVQTLNVLPVSGITGQIIYYTVDSTLRIWDGTQWAPFVTGTIPSAYTSTPAMDGVGSAGSSTSWAKGDHVHPSDTSKQSTSAKDQANGYAGLNASSKIAVSEIPTGNTADTIPKLAGTISDGKVLKYSSADSGFVEASISAVLTYKGSCTYTNLPSSGQQVGDVWNVTDAHGDTPAGTNYAWDGSAWDPLGGDVDLSGYATTTYVNTALAGKAGAYRGTITGDGSTKTFEFTHGLGNIPAVQVFDSSGNFCLPKITATTTKATIVFNTAPGNAVTYSVVCVG
jgi:hypothetical protein